MKAILAMKKYWILLFATVAALVSCGRYIPDPLDVSISVGSGAFSFNLDATYPTISEARKQGWEEGDAVFVFFSGVAAPKHLKMTYSNSVWTIAEYDGATQSPGALGLKNGDKGTMRAVFLPFGSNATVSAIDGSFTFSTTYYAYYLTATLDYTVAENKVSGTFSMTIPDGYVQFFIEDGGATDGGYILGTDSVIPVGVASIAADGSVVETSDKVAGNDMVGYAYGSGDTKGYLFSGKLNGNYHSYRLDGEETVEANAYYFAKTKVADGSRADYFAQPANALASHSAVKLPANGDVYVVQNEKPNKGKWVSVGSGITVPLYHVDVSSIFVGYTIEVVTATPLGNWYTCNYNCTAPEKLGKLYSFDVANGYTTLPTQEQFERLITYCSWTWLTVHGQQGIVVADRGFLFLPAQLATRGLYWSSTEYDYDCGYDLYFHNNGYHYMDLSPRSNEYAVRFLQN